MDIEKNTSLAWHGARTVRSEERSKVVARETKLGLKHFGYGYLGEQPTAFGGWAGTFDCIAFAGDTSQLDSM